MDIDKMEHKLQFSEKEIEQKIKELGTILSSDYKDKNLLIVPLLNGAFIFASDLVRNINLKLSIEFMRTSSYENDTVNSGKVKIMTDIDKDLSNYDVLIVDDIIDSGITLKYVYEHLSLKKPKSLKTCTFLDKPERRQVEFKPDYCGFEVENMFIVGYGLNYGEHYRNIPYIFSVDV